MTEEAVPPGWGRFFFKGSKVWVKVDEMGRPQSADERQVEIYYRREDPKGYLASLSRLMPLDAPQAVEEGIPEGSILAYTDGACHGNPGPAGIGVSLRSGKHHKELSEYLGIATNNIAELTAVLRALQSLKRPVTRPVWILTDSTYVIGVLTGAMKAKTNRDLVREIGRVIASLPEVRFRKVPAHVGIPGNERADRLAQEAIEKQVEPAGVRERPAIQGKPEPGDAPSSLPSVSSSH